MTILTKYGNMDVTLLDRGAFMPDRTDDPGEIYYIRAPKPIWIDPYDSCTIDTGIYINLPDGCEGVLRSRSRPATDALITDETRIDGTGNRSILITMHGGNAAYYLRKGDIIAKLEIRPFAHSYTPENDNDITKVSHIEIKRAQSGRQYLVLYVESKETGFDETVILGDDGYLTKISRDIVESLEQVKRIDTDIFLERDF